MLVIVVNVRGQKRGLKSLCIPCATHIIENIPVLLLTIFNM